MFVSVVLICIWKYIYLYIFFLLCIFLCVCGVIITEQILPHPMAPPFPLFSIALRLSLRHAYISQHCSTRSYCHCYICGTQPAISNPTKTIIFTSRKLLPF